MWANEIHLFRQAGWVHKMLLPWCKWGPSAWLLSFLPNTPIPQLMCHKKLLFGQDPLFPKRGCPLMAVWVPVLSLPFSNTFIPDLATLCPVKELFGSFNYVIISTEVQQKNLPLEVVVPYICLWIAACLDSDSGRWDSPSSNSSIWASVSVLGGWPMATWGCLKPNRKVFSFEEEETAISIACSPKCWGSLASLLFSCLLPHVLESTL